MNHLQYFTYGLLSFEKEASIRFKNDNDGFNQLLDTILSNSNLTLPTENIKRTILDARTLKPKVTK